MAQNWSLMMARISYFLYHFATITAVAVMVSMMIITMLTPETLQRDFVVTLFRWVSFSGCVSLFGAAVSHWVAVLDGEVVDL